VGVQELGGRGRSDGPAPHARWRGAWGRISPPRGGGTEGDRSIRLDIRTGILEEDSALPRQVVGQCNPNGEQAPDGGARQAMPCRFRIVGFCTAGSTSFLWHAPPGGRGEDVHEPSHVIRAVGRKGRPLPFLFTEESNPAVRLHEPDLVGAGLAVEGSFVRHLLRGVRFAKNFYAYLRG
jgi:hypothetical protein